MSKIEYTSTTQTMGDASNEDGEKFAKYAERQLAVDFPGTEIVVRIDNKINTSALRVSDDLDIGYVQQRINHYWDHADWYAA